MRAFNFIEMLAENSPEKSLLMSEKLSNILTYQVLKFNVEDAKDVEHSTKELKQANMGSSEQYFFCMKFKKTNQALKT
jgi:hypothetical protein